MEIPFLNLKQFREPSNLLKYVTPYSFMIKPGLCFLKNAAIMTTYRVSYPDLESSSPGEIAGMAELFNRAAMSLAKEEGWALFFDAIRRRTTAYPSGNFQDLGGFLIDQRRCENYNGHGEHFTNEHYITFVYQLPNDIEEKTTAFFFKKNKKEQTDKKAKKLNLPAVTRECENFLDECEKTMGALSKKLWIHRLDSSELFSYIKSSVSLEWQDMVFPDDVFFFLDNYLCDYDVQTSMPLKIGDYYVPVMCVMDFPSTSYPAIFDGLNRTMTEFRWVTRFIPFSKERSLKEVDKYQKRFYSARKSAATLVTEMTLNVEINRENQGAMALEAQTNELNENITLGNFLVGQYTSNLMVWDKKLSKAKEKARKIQAVIRACGIDAKEETFNNFYAWQSMMPGNVYANVRRPLITTKNFSHIIPLSSAWEGMLYNDFTEETCGQNLPLCVCSTSYGTPFFLNLNVRDVGNTFIFGPVGAGKSTLLALLMQQATKYENANIVCIDKQLSSRAFIVSNGGVYVEPGKDAVAFQPLSELLSPGEASEAEYISSLMWCQQFIEMLLMQQDINVTPAMSKDITETLKLMSKKDRSMRSLTTFQQYASYVDPSTGEQTIKNGINPYCQEGQFGSIFDADATTLPLATRVTIEMQSLMRLSEKAVAPALMYLFRYLEKLWNLPAGKKQPLTFLFLDEAWLYLQHPVFASFLQEWLRTLRKKKVFCIFATQEVEAAAKSTLSATIAQQCLTRIYLADENATSPALAESYRYFGLTDDEILALSTAVMKRDYYFKNPLGRRMFTLDLDPFQLALISPDHKAIDDIEAEHGKNTGKQLAFEILDKAMETAKSLGRDPSVYDYSKYKKMIYKNQGE